MDYLWKSTGIRKSTYEGGVFFEKQGGGVKSEAGRRLYCGRICKQAANLLETEKEGEPTASPGKARTSSHRHSGQ